MAECILTAQQGQYLIKYPSSKRLIGEDLAQSDHALDAAAEKSSNAWAALGDCGSGGSAPPEERFFRLIGVDVGEARVVWGEERVQARQMLTVDCRQKAWRPR